MQEQPYTSVITFDDSKSELIMYTMTEMQRQAFNQPPQHWARPPHQRQGSLPVQLPERHPGSLHRGILLLDLRLHLRLPERTTSA
jgi:hypothetical protein